jgi:predicted NBD/HSP70 family sugar kinase
MTATPFIAAGIDLGGTKIEAQVFDQSWQKTLHRRIDTPQTYDALVAAMADQIAWIEGQSHRNIPVGISAAGLINPGTGLALTANLPASGRPFPADIRSASGHKISYLNDCRAFILSESRFGAAQGASPALGLILGTGVAGGVVMDGRLMSGFATVGGEFGHFPAAAGPIHRHNLPVVACACGRFGCTETLLAGPGLARIAAHVTGRSISAEDITAGRASDPGLAKVWSIWRELAAELLVTFCMTIDPQVVVLGGGLSRAPGLVDDLSGALRRAMFDGFRCPEIRLAQGGDASGARGAAYAAWQDADTAISPNGKEPS